MSVYIRSRISFRLYFVNILALKGLPREAIGTFRQVKHPLNHDIYYSFTSIYKFKSLAYVLSSYPFINFSFYIIFFLQGKTEIGNLF